MKKFELYGIAEPGRIIFPGHGELILANIDDEKAAELYKAGCPYIKPCPTMREKLVPAEKVIKPAPLPVVDDKSPEEGKQHYPQKPRKTRK